jgi:hypothetical protein
METVLTRDTDVLREYLSILDSRLRDSSPFGRFAATIKLAQLGRELHASQIEATDDDLSALLRDVNDRLDQTGMRRFQSRPWGARVFVFLAAIVGQQLPLAVVLLLTALFLQFAPRPAWNPLLPREEPIFLLAFLFLFFVATPLVVLALVFGGRYFHAWRVTVPATLLMILVAAGCSALTVRGKSNPVSQWSSLYRFLNERGLTRATYEQWLDSNWLLKDEKFRRDYEAYLRGGPGRWITSRFNSNDDGAWIGSLQYMGEYIETGRDPKSFRDWLQYYLERNRIYSEDRAEQEARSIAGEANERYLGVWEVEPYLRERDKRVYAAYMGAVSRDMNRWNILLLGVLAVVLVLVYLVGQVFGVSNWVSARIRIGSDSRGTPGSSAHFEFPERREITTPPFFDTPFKVLARVHRVFLGRVVFASVIVCLFWIAVYSFTLSSDTQNPTSQVALMKSRVLLVGESRDEPTGSALRVAGVGGGASETGPITASEASLALRLRELERRLDDAEYDHTKKTRAQERELESLKRDTESLRSQTAQLQPLPEQVNQLGTRASAVESRAELLSGEVNAAKQQADSVDKRITSKLSDVESKASRAADEASRAGDRSSMLATRTEALEKELDRRAGQIEARTEELGERTVSLGETTEKIDRLQKVTAAAVLSQLRADTEDLERRIDSAFYRFFYKGEARRAAESLRQRISNLAADLSKVDTDEARKLIEQINELGQQVEKIEARLN